MMDRLSTDELELFLVLAWLIWHQHNTVVRGGKFQDLGALNRRALDNLEEFSHGPVPAAQGNMPPAVWQPPPFDFYKSNFDAASFTNPSALALF